LSSDTNIRISYQDRVDQEAGWIHEFRAYRTSLYTEDGKDKTEPRGRETVVAQIPGFYRNTKRPLLHDKKLREEGEFGETHEGPARNLS
jgi:hypothetical protein